MPSRLAVTATLLTMTASAVTASASDWTPRAWADANTLEIRTTRAGEGEHWFPVWLVVFDDQVYVRLGTRAASRLERNVTAPWVGMRVAGQPFDRVKAVPVPALTERVAHAMAAKYWSDLIVRHFSHPLTVRLEPASGEPATP